MTLPDDSKLLQNIKNLLHQARTKVMQTVNSTMVTTYFEIGRLIVEHEQKGREKAEYGKNTLKSLSKQLLVEFGKGFSLRNLEMMRKFYLVYQKTQTLSAQLKTPATLSSKFTLSWSHYVFLMRLEKQQRLFYEQEAIDNNWSLRELKRQFDTALFDRVRLSKHKDKVKKLNQKGRIPTSPKEVIKDPYILEFLGLKEDSHYSETQIEQAIIDKNVRQLLRSLHQNRGQKSHNRHCSLPK